MSDDRHHDTGYNGKISMPYLSIGVNRSPNCISWSPNGLIAYGGCSSVILYKYQDELHAGSAIAALNGHTARVNCVKWLTDTELLSGSADHSILNWHFQNNLWKVKSTLSGHTGSVTCIAILRNSGNFLVATAATDSTLNIWRRETADRNFQRIQTISFGHGIALAVALTTLQSTIDKKDHCDNYLMATTRENCKVNLYVGNSSDSKLEFQLIMSLSGHENWIRDLAFGYGDNDSILLASCAEDTYIRIWKIVPVNDNNDLVDKTNSEDKELKLKENIFHLKFDDQEKESYVVTLDSVLSCHEDMVYSVNWCPDIENEHHLRLLSASMDKTMIIWEYDRDSGMWLDKVRVGTMGGNNLGFYGGIFSPDGKEVLAQGYDGGLHAWKSISDRNEHWKPQVTVTGHFAPVQDFDWESSNGTFLVSVSSDQTTRIHAPWITSTKVSTWHEIARPQIHGYDMQCVLLADCDQIVSGGEEKVIRIFKSPKLFSSTLLEISQVELESLRISSDASTKAPLGASVPSLGLSNKAMYDDKEDGDSNEDFSDRFNMIPTAFKPIELKEPPTELYLQQNTLWPEIQKLYGHPYELFCLAYNRQRQLLASACKARKPEHAAIIIWDTQTWRQACEPLLCHNLTVTQMAFSHNGDWLLSVSRDRGWSLYQFTKLSSGLSCKNVYHAGYKASMHSRIIWSCSWSHDDKYFATASRDKKVIIWHQSQSHTWIPASSPLELSDSVTAVDFAPIFSKNKRYIMCVGLDCGKLEFYTWSSEQLHWQKCCTLPENYNHSSTVKRIRWRPISEAIKKDYESERENYPLQIGCCSTDHSVRIFTIPYDNFS